MRARVTWHSFLMAGLFLALLFGLCLVPATVLAGGTVGNGTPASCTEGALEAVLTAGGNVTFDCGPGPHVIPLTRQIAVGLSTVIDGGGLVTLSGGDAVRLFEVSAPATLTLRDLGLLNGNSGTRDGGAVLNNGTLVVEGCTLSDNTAGAAYCGGAIASSGPVTIVDSTLARNQAGDGGGVCLQAGTGPVSIRDSDFSENSATNPSGGWGGALLIAEGGSVSIEGGTFDWNDANTGGAIYCPPHSDLAAVGSSFQHNRAWSGGGIAGSHAEIALSDVAMGDNWATMDGGGVLNNEAPLSVVGSIFAGNSAGNRGGGVYLYRGSLSVTDTTFAGNRARLDGGGLRIWETATTLDRVTLSDNFAGRAGGGLHVYYSVATLTNVTFSGNTADVKGGAIGNWGGVTKLVNVSLGGNSAPLGGALSHKAGGWSASTLSLDNSLLAQGETGANCYLEPGSVTPIVSKGYNLSSDASCQPYFTRSGDQNSRDPKLGPLADNGGKTMTFLPQQGSLAINLGQCVEGVSTDQRDVARPQSFACDIGSVEVRLDHLWQSYVPLVGRRFR